MFKYLLVNIAPPVVTCFVEWYDDTIMISTNVKAINTVRLFEKVKSGIVRISQFHSTAALQWYEGDAVRVRAGVV